MTSVAITDHSVIREPRMFRARHAVVNVPWFIWFIGLSALMFLQLSQTISAVVFTVAMLLYALYRPNRVLDALGGSVILWPFLLLITLSLLWSDAPDWTLRQIGETYLTGMAAVLMALSLPARSFISVIMWSCLVATVASVIYVGGNVFGELRSGGIVGIFLGSKNSLGGVEAILILAGVWIIADSRRSSLARLMTLPCLLAGAVMLYGSRSVSAIAAVGFALIISATAYFIGRITPQHRGLLIVGIVFTGAMLGLLLMLFAGDLYAQFLTVSGKNASLSDRTILWDWANRVIIPAHPVLGVGYRAFWVESNPYAGELVRIFGIGPKIHFHNQWYELVVELGYVGLAVSVFTFFGYTIATMRWAARALSSESWLYLGFAVYALIRSYVEVDLFAPFMFPFIVFIVGYIHARKGLSSGNGGTKAAFAV